MSLQRTLALSNPKYQASLGKYQSGGALTPEEIELLREASMFDDNVYKQNMSTPQGQNSAQAMALANKEKELALQAQEAEAKKRQGLNPDGSPIAPEWNSILDQDGNLQDKYQVSPWETVTANTDALGKIRETALRGAGEQSPWAKMMLEKNTIEQAEAADNAARSGQSGLMSAMSQLAQRGGISGGARERLTRRATQDALLQKQQAGRQGMLDRMNILTQDEGNRLSQLQQLQGMENQQADLNFRNQSADKQLQGTNLMNMLKEVDGKRGYDQGMYKERMSAWAADKQSQAQARAAGGGGKK